VSPRVSVVIPAKNEEMNIGLVLDELTSTISQMNGHEVEVIVVDDRSSDRTGEVARLRGARVIRNEGPCGKGRALRLGFQNATGDIIVMMDADHSHRPEDIPEFLAQMRDGIGLVIGSRVYGGSDEYTPIRALGNVFLTAALGLFLGRYLSDALNGFKAFRREIFDDFDYTSKTFEIEIELIANTLRKGYRVVEISSHERARLGGEAKSRVIRHGWRFFWRVFTEWLRNKGMLPSNARKCANSEGVLIPARPRVAASSAPGDLNARHAAQLPPFRRILVAELPITLIGVLLFGSAGRWDLSAGWAYLALWTVAAVTAMFLIHKKDPTLWEERFHPGSSGKDPHLQRVGRPCFVLHLIIAGLDVGRFHWSGSVPFGVQFAGLAGVAAALALVVWAMAVNPFFSSVVRIQRDRGQHLITMGPYRYVRHPGYAAVLVYALNGPLALGSYWSALLLIPVVPMILRRTRLEDKLICEELEGYAEYAQRVRYRLVPGVW